MNHTLDLTSLPINPINSPFQTFPPSSSSLRPGVTEPAGMKAQVRPVANVSSPTVTDRPKLWRSRPNNTHRGEFRIKPGTGAPGRLWALRAAACSCPDLPSLSPGRSATGPSDRDSCSLRSIFHSNRAAVDESRGALPLSQREGWSACTTASKKKAHGAVTWSGLHCDGRQAVRSR